jgi:predicted acyl esterase
MTILMVATMGFESRAQVVSYDRDPVYDGIMQTSQYINSFDETRLAITIIRPTLKGQVAKEPLPVIMYQDRAMMGSFLTSTVRYFTDRGYIFVLQDRRGKGASFGFETGFLDRNVVKDAIKKSGIAILQFMGWWDGSSITGKNISTRSLQWLLQNAIQRGRTQLPVHNN